MTEMLGSTHAVEIKPQARMRTRVLREEGSAHRATILVLRERLLRARNKLAALEKDLEDRQVEFDNLVQANETKAPAVVNNDMAKHEKRLSAAILETEYATMRMISALATLNERLTSEYAITRQFTNGTYTPPPQRKNRSG